MIEKQVMADDEIKKKLEHLLVDTTKYDFVMNNIDSLYIFYGSVQGIVHQIIVSEFFDEVESVHINSFAKYFVDNNKEYIEELYAFIKL